MEAITAIVSALIVAVIFISGYFWGRQSGLSDSLEEATRKHNQRLIKKLKEKPCNSTHGQK